jgi:tRNA(Ile)-lysidine synthase
VSTAEHAVRDDEANALFLGLENLPGLILAVSGGPDSTALLVLVARWAKRQKRAPKLLAVTVDHALRPAAKREAAAVKRLARRFGIAHRTLRWRGTKPRSGLPERAREARYGLLSQAALRAGYAHVVTAHTLDDQAETVLFRLARGSGIGGLAAMARVSPLPHVGAATVFLVRPLLQLPKLRLIATLQSAGIAYSDDPTNRDPRYTRARWRRLMPVLAQEGLDARGLARLAARMRRADTAIEFAAGAARAALAPGPWPPRGPVVFATAQFAELPAEVALRVLGRAIAHTGDEGPVELAKLETLYDALRAADSRLRRTLAGALVTLAGDRLTVERAPPRRGPVRPNRGKSGFKGRFTK